jgi:hypothetical protein
MFNQLVPPELDGGIKCLSNVLLWLVVLVCVQRLPYFIFVGGCQTFSLSVPHTKLVSDVVVVCPSLGPPFFPESVIFHILSFEKGSLGIIGLSSTQFSEGSQVTPVVGRQTLPSHFWTFSLPSLEVSFRSPPERKSLPSLTIFVLQYI